VDNMRFRSSVTSHSLSLKTKLKTMPIYTSNNSTDLIRARSVEGQTTRNPSVVGWDRGIQETVTKVLCVYFFFVCV
jgi:hypothetical protein